jgi:hypothetical protein
MTDRGGYMNKYEATLRIWREAKPPGDAPSQLSYFRKLRDRLHEIPEGVDLAQTTEVVLRLRNWLPGVTLDGALDRVVTAVRQGIDPFMIEETLKFVVQSQGGFVRIDLGAFIFQYTLPQIRAGKGVWDMLPPQDRAAIQVDTLLAAGLEEHPDVVALVLQEMQSLQGVGLQVAELLKDCACPPVAFDLWKAVRGTGPLRERELELLAQAVLSVGHRSEQTEEHGLRILSEEETVARFGRSM